MSGLNIIRPKWRTVSAHDLPQGVLNIGLTGGIGSGKSTVARILRAHGFPVVDMDALSHALTAVGGEAITAIAQTFGQDYITEQGALNRAKMRAHVFAKPAARQQLESILHPLIDTHTLLQGLIAAQAGARCVFYDIPLLAESPRWQARLDGIVVVQCSREEQIKRIQTRNPDLPLSIVTQMIGAQATAQKRESLANILINNQKNHKKTLHLHAQIDILAQHIELDFQKSQRFSKSLIIPT